MKKRVGCIIVFIIVVISSLFHICIAANDEEFIQDVEMPAEFSETHKNYRCFTVTKTGVYSIGYTYPGYGVLPTNVYTVPSDTNRTYRIDEQCY